MNSLIVEEIYKSYNENTVLSGLSFSVKQGEFISVLGASGCGKTTLLRIIAGLETCDQGKKFMRVLILLIVHHHIETLEWCFKIIHCSQI